MAYQLYDRLLGGKLQALLEAWRSEGMSFPDIAFKLRSEHDIAVSDETIRRWAKTLGIPEPERAAS